MRLNKALVDRNNRPESLAAAAPPARPAVKLLLRRLMGRVSRYGHPQPAKHPLEKFLANPFE